MVDEEWELLKLIAEDKGIVLARQYSEDQASHFLDMDLSTLKRLRRSGFTGDIGKNMGQRKIRYLGLDICRAIRNGFPNADRKNPAETEHGANQLNGEAPWQTEHSRSAKAG